jgi:hypothetical protein
MPTFKNKFVRCSLPLIALASLIGCTSEIGGDDASVGSGDDDPSLCRSNSECVHPDLCRLCDDGSSSCAQAASVHQRCVTSFPECPAPTPGVFCGGIAGIPCAGAGRCVDNPSDSCDPKMGGADCGGICSCGPQTQLCIRGSHFDSSPSVCACVPDAGPACGTKTCPAGEVCCNASCGTCVPPGNFCTQIACAPEL